MLLATSDAMVVRGKRPVLAVVVHVEELYVHCAKAFLRSSLWEPDSWPDGPQCPALARPDSQGPDGPARRPGEGD